MKRIIGIVGPIAAGKDTLAEYFAMRLNWPTFATSGVLKEIARDRKIGTSRDNLIVLGRKIAREKGSAYLAKAMLEKAGKAAILTGMRQVEQIKYLQENCKLTLVSIDTDSERRFKRAYARHRAGEAGTLKEFIKNEEVENSDYQAQQVYKCMAMADYHVDNSGTKENLHKEADKIIARIIIKQSP